MTHTNKRRQQIEAHLRSRQNNPAPSPTQTISAALPEDSFFAQIDRRPRPPKSGVAMCHRQGKTAVYISECKQYIIKEPPHGPVTRTLRSPDARGL